MIRIDQYSKSDPITKLTKFAWALARLVSQTSSINDFIFPLSCHLIEGDTCEIANAKGKQLGRLHSPLAEEFIKWINFQIQPPSKVEAADPIDCKCTARELRSGDHFSYPGSFKIYQALSDPEVDPDFHRATYHCTSCGQLAMHHPRVILDATDGGLNQCIGIRLRSDVECRIHKSFEDE